MKRVSKDVLFSIAMQMDLPNLLRFCSSSKNINELICQRNDIWYQKIHNEFPKYSESLKQKTPRETYILLYKLSILIQKLNLNFSMEKLYNSKIISLSFENIYEIPKEIGALVNVEDLYLSFNNITKIPKEISSLVNLEILDLKHNLIKEIPKELGSMIKLRSLLLQNNYEVVIPNEVSSLPNLTIFR